MSGTGGWRIPRRVPPPHHAEHTDRKRKSALTVRQEPLTENSPRGPGRALHPRGARRRKAQHASPFRTRKSAIVPPSGESPECFVRIPSRRTMIRGVHGSRIGRLTAATALLWLMTAPAPAVADACAVAVIGPDGTITAVAVAGSGVCTPPPTPPPSPEPTPPPPSPTPPPPPSPTPEPEPSPAPEPPPPPPKPRPPAPRALPPPTPRPTPRTPVPAPPPPSPKPSPSPPPSPTPSAHPTARVVALPAYRKPHRQVHDSGTSLVTLTLMITAPAVFAVAVLRPRSSR